MAETAVDPQLQEALARVAPGTGLREAIDMIIAARIGALICIGDVDNVAALSNGGFRIAAPFAPQRLFELAKMDGAITLDDAGQTIIGANIHLAPDPTLPTSETGMRHRTAERVSRQTDALVISVSQRRDVVSLYRNGSRAFLERTELLLSKANQALQTLQNYRSRLDESLVRLTVLEFDDLVTFGEVSEVIGRLGMLRRIHLEVERYIVRLGTDGRLLRMQANEITATIGDAFLLVIRDYAASNGPRSAQSIRDRLDELPLEDLFEPTVIARELGYETLDASEEHIASRGYRVMSRIPMLPLAVVSRLVERFASLSEIAKATPDTLDAVDGISARRARAIASGLAQLRANLR